MLFGAPMAMAVQVSPWGLICDPLFFRADLEQGSPVPSAGPICVVNDPTECFGIWLISWKLACACIAGQCTGLPESGLEAGARCSQPAGASA